MSTRLRTRASQAARVALLLFCSASFGSWLGWIASADAPAYDRRQWGSWIDEDGDCRNTRAEVLIRDNRGTLRFKLEVNGEECLVVAGLWRDPYTGRYYTDAADVQIDHTVALKDAHETGGGAWPEERKRQYSNDLGYRRHLRAIGKTTNASKGARGPDQWRPPRIEAWCEYAEARMVIKGFWGLRISGPEQAALREMLARC